MWQKQEEVEYNEVEGINSTIYCKRAQIGCNW